MEAPPRPPRVKPIIKVDPRGQQFESRDNEIPLYDSVGVVYAKPHKSRDFPSQTEDGGQVATDLVTNEEEVYDNTILPNNKTEAIQNNIYGQEGGLYFYDNNVDDNAPFPKARGVMSYDTVTLHPRPLEIEKSEVEKESEYSLQRPLSETFVKQPPPSVSSQQSHLNLHASQPLSISHSTKIEDDKIKIIFELKSQSSGDETFDRVPMRLVCLFDISGSMAQKFSSQEIGYKERPTKLKKMKNVAKIITQTLDETDFLGILSFGEDTEILWPLMENKASVKKKVFSQIQALGKSGLSLTTNLSRGVFAALDMFREDSKKRGLRCFDTRDVIVILTDGDINDGITDGQKLVKEVRKAIRDLEMEGRHYSREPSLTISTVVTGNNVSDAMYLLSKTCGSDAYYFIDKDAGALEIGTLMPVLLRKTCASSSISIKIKCMDPAEFIPKLCSHEYMAHRPHEKDDELNYFLHDLSVGMSKHLLVVLDKESVMVETDLNANTLLVEMQYRDSLMQKQTLQYKLSRGEILPNCSKPSQNLAVSIQDIRRISQIALRDVADHIKKEHPDLAASALLQSTEDVEKVVKDFTGNLGEASDVKKLTEFVKSVTSSLAYLVETVADTQCSAGESWSSVKAVSSAISREAPSALRLLSQDKDFAESVNGSEEYSEIRRIIREQYSRRGIYSAIFYDFDVTMNEMSDTLRRGARPLFDISDEGSERSSPITYPLTAQTDTDDIYTYSSQLGD